MAAAHARKHQQSTATATARAREALWRGSFPKSTFETRLARLMQDMENSPWSRAIREIENSPITKMLRDMEKLQNLPFMRRMREFENYRAGHAGDTGDKSVMDESEHRGHGSQRNELA